MMLQNSICLAAICAGSSILSCWARSMFPVCLIRVKPGETVRPAHSHPNGEEVIYIIKGSGRVLVNGEVGEAKEGSIVLFPQGEIHMLQNTGASEMKVICFFAPPTDLGTYKFFEDVEFPA